MNIDSDLNYLDYRAFGRAAQRRLFKRRPILTVLRLVLFGIFLLPVVGVVLPYEGLPFVVLRFGGFFLAFGIGLGITYMLAMSLAVRPAANGRILGQKLMTLDERGIRVKGQHHETFTEWKGVHEAVETATHWFLFVDNVQGFVIPKRDLDGEVLETLQEVIQRGTSQERAGQVAA